MRPPARRTRSKRHGPVLVRAGVLLLGVATVSACQLPDVSMSPAVDRTTAAPTSRSPEAATTSAPVSSAAAATVAVVAPVTATRSPGELDVGSATHVLAAGERQLVVDWWTDEPAATWTATDAKTIQLSAHLEGGDPDDDLEVLVTRFTAVLDDGTTRTPVDEDSGEFAIQAPYTYGTVLTLPPSVAGALSLTVSIQFDLLIETEPDSGRYFRQTVLDSLALPVVPQEIP